MSGVMSGCSEPKGIEAVRAHCVAALEIQENELFICSAPSLQDLTCSMRRVVRISYLSESDLRDGIEGGASKHVLSIERLYKTRQERTHRLNESCSCIVTELQNAVAGQLTG